ncbi:MAG TPA: 16S rRNA (guanine(527)-N(7))-methyltransferase RsmG [Bacteroidota bacterium]
MSTTESPAIWLRNVCRKNGLALNDEQVRLLDLYVHLLLDRNSKINLISRQDEDRVWQNHILHSISILFKIGLRPGSRIIDMGTGGGLPGIPLKILLPDTEWLLMDATRKKVTAVQEILANMGLRGVTAVWGRAEDLALDKNLRSQFDYIVARAVAPLKQLIQWSKPFLGKRADGGVSAANDTLVSPPALIALKGGELGDELEEAAKATLAGSMNTINLVFAGSEDLSASGKKIVIVKF